MMSTAVKIKIRSYRDSDYPKLKKNLINGGLFLENWDTRKNLARKIQRNPNSILVATINKQIIGNVYIVEDGWSATISRLCVREEHRNKGIGSKLLAEAEKILKEKGRKEIALYVDEENTDLKNFYKKREYFLGGNCRCMRKIVL